MVKPKRKLIKSLTDCRKLINNKLKDLLKLITKNKCKHFTVFVNILTIQFAKTIKKVLYLRKR